MNGSTQTRGEGKETSPTRLSRTEAKRVKILRAARQVFLAHGFQTASMDLVATTAGVSKTTIYSKFGSKNELFSAIVDDICEQILAMEIVVPETADTTRDALVELAVNYARALFDPEVLALVRLAIGEQRQHKDIGRIYHQAGPARARAGLVDLFRSLSARGDLVVSDVELAADQFVGLLQPQRYYSLLDPAVTPTIAEIDRIASAGAEVFLSHYASPERD